MFFGSSVFEMRNSGHCKGKMWLTITKKKVDLIAGTIRFVCTAQCKWVNYLMASCVQALSDSQV